LQEVELDSMFFQRRRCAVVGDRCIPKSYAGEQAMRFLVEKTVMLGWRVLRSRR
jgi:hypothetical protein